MNAQAMTSVARIARVTTIRLLTLVCIFGKNLQPDDPSRPTRTTNF